MLGSFLEVGVGTRDIGSTYAAFQSLGFVAVTPGAVRGEGYAVMSDGTAYIGLYARNHDEISLTFVRPDLEQYVHALRRRGIELERARLGDQDFNEVAFRDPCGQLVTLVEARTFSPAIEQHRRPSLCGRYLEFSLATRELDDAYAFWEGLGLVGIAGGDEPHPWRRLGTRGFALGLYETTRFEPGLSFTATQLVARIEYLRAKGFAVEKRAPHFPESRPSATISVGDAATLYLAADPADAD